VSQREVCKTYLPGRLAGREASAWDDLVNSVEQSDVSQLMAWTRVRSALGFSAMHVTVARGDQLVAGAQVLVRRFPVFGSIGYVAHGPVVGDGIEHRAAACASVAQGLITLMHDGGIRVLFVQPPIGGDDVSAALADKGFHVSHAGVAPPETVCLDLTRPEDELRNGFNKRLRGWTRRWPDRGVTVRRGDERDLPLLADLLAQSFEYQHGEAIPLEYLQRVYDALAPSGNAVLFIGEVEGKAVAADLLTVSGGVMRDRFIGFDRESGASNLSVPGAVKWNAILWAKENGVHWLDFGGVERHVVETMLAGEKVDQKTVRGGDQFKLSFGGAPFILPPAMEFARPMQLLRAYHMVEGNERGRATVGAIRRRLRGGGA
jgi:lipid II:glycine glycyltransferase (peptidoglycan interpeptide bridge formation enzyme)